MREIKFRAWNNEIKKIVDVEKIDLEYGRVWLSDTINSHEYIDDDHITLEQYTGLQDKNGKEIYEGDRYRSSTGFVGTIKWNRFVSGFEPFICEDYRKYEPIEIIGNIHEGEKQ